jgi:pimeloyl-ACP methyl ester carboxylesterase
MVGTIAVGIIVLLVLAVALIWVLGSRAKARLAAQYPAPGRMVDVGGYRLHIYSQGEAAPGVPTVVMEGGNAEPCLTWAAVQPEVARFARVCTYDRAGLGWSERGALPRTAANIVSELHTLLANAGVQPPFVLVGHSIGGLYVRMYAHEHPEQVAGMVLVDSAHEQQDLRFPESLQRMQRQSEKMMAVAMRLLALLNSSGILAVLAEMGRMPWPMPLPQQARAAYLARVCSGGRYLATATEESMAAAGNLAAGRAAKITTLGDIPLVVLSAGKSPISGVRGIPAEDVERMNRVFSEFPVELARLSPRGKRVLAEKSGHYIHVEQPELVIDAIREVVEASRA